MIPCRHAAPGGDSRTQMMTCFGLAVAGCGMFTAYASILFLRKKAGSWAF